MDRRLKESLVENVEKHYEEVESMVEGVCAVSGRINDNIDDVRLGVLQEWYLGRTYRHGFYRGPDHRLSSIPENFGAVSTALKKTVSSDAAFGVPLSSCVDSGVRHLSPRINRGIPNNEPPPSRSMGFSRTRRLLV